MAFTENEAVLERLDVRYDQEGLYGNRGESYDDESWDDESYDDESYDDESWDDESYDDESAEFRFRPLDLLTGGASAAVRAASNVLGKGGRRPVRLQGVRPRLTGTGGINPLSNLAGTMTNQQGRPFQVRLPQNIATKDDIAVLKRSIDALNATTVKTTEAVNKNAGETAKIASEVNRIDAKHTKASQAQNQAISRLNKQSARVGKRVNLMGKRMEKMDKDFKNAQQQSQMSMLLPMMLSSDPKIEKITLNPGTTGTAALNTAYNAQATFKKEDNTMLMLLPMMMGGGFGSGSDSMMPLLMVLALSK
ncbi:MAG: hypothetical protein R2828_07390 [Saprospiraceae bacterium]